MSKQATTADRRLGPSQRSEPMGGERATLPLYRTDPEIIADVEAAMDRDLSSPPLGSSVLRVDVRDGVVALSGYVSEHGSRARTEEVIGSVHGIRGLQSELIADDELQARVAQSLSDGARTRGYYIRVHVADGIVHLTDALEGAALSTEVVDAAEEVAANVPGVRAVVVQLREVEASPHPQPILPRTGLPVYTTDGRLGRLEAVVMSRRFRRVTHLIVAGRVFADGAADPVVGSESESRHWLVPVSAVAHVTAEAVLLGVGRDGVPALPEGAADAFAVPDPSWQPSFDYRRQDVRLIGAE